MVGGTTSMLWAPVVEFLPTTAKAIGGTILAGIGAATAIKAWLMTRRQQREGRNGD